MNISKKKIFLLCSAIFLTSCAITPIIRDRKEASYDGNEQTSGILRFLPDGSLEITESARIRYNALIKLYGDRTLPSTGADFGVTPIEGGHYSLTLEGADRWKRMSLMMEQDKTK